ncbi:unnamed protein product [Calypogeia fissa]
MDLKEMEEMMSNPLNLQPAGDTFTLEGARLLTTEASASPSSPRAMGWEDMVSWSHMFKDEIPVEEVFRSSFLDLYDDHLFSFTIWDHALEAFQELNGEDGIGPATSVETLLDSFRPILSDRVMSEICGNIEDLRKSKLEIDTLFVQMKRSVFSTILCDLKSCAYSMEEQNKSREPNEQVENGGVRRGGGEGEASILPYNIC